MLLYALILLASVCTRSVADVTHNVPTKNLATNDVDIAPSRQFLRRSKIEKEERTMDMETFEVLDEMVIPSPEEIEAFDTLVAELKASVVDHKNAQQRLIAELNDDKTLNDPSDSQNLEIWLRRVFKLNDINPTEYHTLVSVLEQRFGKVELAEKLETFSHGRGLRTARNAAKLQRQQLVQWVQNEEPIMKNLKIDQRATLVSSTWKETVLEKCIDIYNEMMQRHETLASTYAQAYGITNLLKMLSKTQSIKPVQKYARDFATRIQNQLLEAWKENGLPIDEVLANVKLKEVVKLLMTSEPSLVTGMYPVIKPSSKSSHLYSWVEILSSCYSTDNVMNELFRLRRRNKRASTLLDQEMERWVEKRKFRSHSSTTRGRRDLQELFLEVAKNNINEEKHE